MKGRVKMRILVTGANGMLAKEVKVAQLAGFNVLKMVCV